MVGKGSEMVGSGSGRVGSGNTIVGTASVGRGTMTVGWGRGGCVAGGRAVGVPSVLGVWVGTGDGVRGEDTISSGR